MGPKLARSNARVKHSRVRFAKQFHTETPLTLRTPRGKDLEDAIQYMKEHDKEFVPLTNNVDHGLDHLRSYVMNTKQVSETSQYVFDRYFSRFRRKSGIKRS